MKKKWGLFVLFTVIFMMFSIISIKLYHSGMSDSISVNAKDIPDNSILEADNIVSSDDAISEDSIPNEDGFDDSTDSDMVQMAGDEILVDDGYLDTSMLDKSEDIYEKLRKGQLTKQEVDDLIEKGLTVADIVDPYAVMPISIVDGVVDPKWFDFEVDEPGDETAAKYGSYDDLRSVYTYLGKWDGPTTGVQAGEDLAYYQNYYPNLDGSATNIEYEVTRISYHDTAVYRLGNVHITTSDGVVHEYVYVSPQLNRGVTSYFVIPDTAKITICYSPIEYEVTYEVYVDGISSASINPSTGLHAIYGGYRDGSTTDQHVGVTVTVPYGYIGRVFIGNTADSNDENKFPKKLTGYKGSDYEVFPEEQNYGKYPLGMEPIYELYGDSDAEPPNKIDTGPDGPGYFTLTGTYSSGDVGGADYDLTVRVVLEERDMFTISDHLWRQTQTSTVVQTDKLIGDSLYNKEFDLNSDKNFSISVKPDDDYTWKFTVKETLEKDDWGFDRYVHYELRTLTVNGDYVEVPIIDNLYGNNLSSAKATTSLGYADVTVETKGIDLLNSYYGYPEYPGYNDYVSYAKTQSSKGYHSARYLREYNITFKNVKRDLVITTSALAKQDDTELVISALDGVLLELWSRTDPDSPFAWHETFHSESFHYDNNIDYEEFAPGTSYNARFKLRDGYEWKDGDVNKSIYYANKTGDDKITFSGLKPENDGWYYIALPEIEKTRVMSIEGELKHYRVTYFDGVNDGTALQSGITGLPETVLDGGIDVRNMPDYTEWSGEAHVDNNGGSLYDVLNNNIITINSNIPMDSEGTDRPAVFQFWVLTDEKGSPISKDGKILKRDDYIDGEGALASVDLGKLMTFKGNTVANLSDLWSEAGFYSKTQYDIYLTAYWLPAATPFVYYVTFNKVDENGRLQRDVYLPNGTEFPMMDEEGKPIEDSTGKQRYAATKREAYAKVESSTAVFDPDSELADTWLAANPWYKFDDSGKYNIGTGRTYNGEGYIYTLSNCDEMDVWAVYTRGGLAISKILEQAGSSGAGKLFEYEITFELPADDPGTTGNESTFFGKDGTYSIGCARNGVRSDFNLVSENGVYKGTFTLADGDNIVFDDMPAGTRYSISEKTEENLGYKFIRTRSGLTDRATRAYSTDSYESPVRNGVITARADISEEYTNRMGLIVEKTQSVRGHDHTKDDVPVLAGEIMTYAITITNITEYDVEVSIHDVLPPGLVFFDNLSDMGSLYTDAYSNTVTWDGVKVGGTKSGNNSCTIMFRAKVTGVDGDILTNSAYAVESTVLGDVQYDSNEVNSIVGSVFNAPETGGNGALLINAAGFLLIIIGIMLGCVTYVDVYRRKRL